MGEISYTQKTHRSKQVGVVEATAGPKGRGGWNEGRQELRANRWARCLDYVARRAPSNSYYDGDKKRGQRK